MNNPNIPNPIANPSVTTTYTVTVSDGSGCSATDQVTIFVGNGGVANAGPDQTICQGSFAQLSASGGTSYSWSPSIGLNNPNIPNPIANPSVTTTYTVTVSDGSGCSAVDQVTIFVGNGGVANAGPDQTICQGSFAQLSASGGTVYTWSPSIGLNNSNIANPVANPSVTTTYTVTVSDGSGCSAVDQVTIFVGNGGVANAGPDQTICQGGFVQLSASGGISYTWSPAIGLNNPNIANPIANPNVTTTYTVVVSDGTGCAASDQVTVFVGSNSIVNAGTDISICRGETIQLNASGGTNYSWSPSIGLSNSSIANPIANPQITTTYTVTSIAGGCSSTDEVTIFVRDTPIISPAIINPSCCNSDGVISLVVSGGSGNFTYKWSPSISNTNTATGLPAGNYSVTVSDIMGCDVVGSITLTQDCGDCKSIVPETEVTVASGSNIGQICLPIDLADIDRYEITANGTILTPNHGCDFQNLTAYSYSFLPGIGNEGPYKIDNWVVNGISYGGMVNNMLELVNWMNSLDPTGNWLYDSQVLLIIGGNPSNDYGTLTITQLSSWVTTMLPPNVSGIATGTLVEVPLNGASEVEVVIIDKETCCEDWVTVKQASGPRFDCEVDIIETSIMNVSSDDCDGTTVVCLPVPLATMTDYTLLDNGLPYNEGFTACEMDTLYAYSYYTLPSLGNGGPYQVNSWRVNGNNHSGSFNSIAQLVEKMNEWDLAKNWVIDEATLTIQGGLPSNAYGKMEIEQVSTGASATLELNTNRVAKGTQVQLTQGEHFLTFINKTSNCVDRLVVNISCEASQRVDCAVPFSSMSIEHEVSDCSIESSLCIPIAAADLGNYSITHNGSIYAGEIGNCADSDDMIMLRAGVGTHNFIFTNAQTGCSADLEVNVACSTQQQETNPITDIKSLDRTPTVLTDAGKSLLLPQLGHSIVKTMVDEPVIIEIPADERVARAIRTFTIIEQPQYGKASIDASNQLIYKPSAAYCDAAQPDYFSYEICTADGCDIGEVEVIVECQAIKVYSGFSPNRDGINDYFKIEGLEVYPDNKLQIFNRRGTILFSQENYRNNWDGTLNGRDLPEGTYFYLLEDGKGKQYKGFIQLNR